MFSCNYKQTFLKMNQFYLNQHRVQKNMKHTSDKSHFITSSCEHHPYRNTHNKMLTRLTFSMFPIISGEIFLKKSKALPFDSIILIDVQNSTNSQISHNLWFIFGQICILYVCKAKSQKNF